MNAGVAIGTGNSKAGTSIKLKLVCVKFVNKMFRTKYNEEMKQWSGELTKSDWNGETSLGIEIFKALKLYKSKVAQICAITGDIKTFEDVRVLTVCAVKNLQRMGCDKGEKLFVFIGNVPDVTPLLFGAICLGCPIVSVPKNSSQAECEYFLNITKPKFAICDIKSYFMLRKCFGNLNINAKIITDNGQADNSVLISVKLNPMVETAFISRTSGTTGFNKAICISHATILDKMARLRDFFRSTDVILKYVGLEGVAGIRYLLGAVLNGSALIVNAGPFSPPRFFELVERFKVTTAYAGAYAIVQLQQHPGIETANLNTIRLFVCGGSSVSNHVIHKMSKYLKNGHFCSTYGLTETFGTVACNLRHTRNNCAGQLIGGDVIKIVNDQGKRLGVNETGEVCIKLPFPFPGYLNSTEDMDGYVDKEGFFITGDEGRFDENGDLFIDNRKREIFKRYGTKISPVEMETFINDIEGVKQSCVVPIPVETVGCIAAAVIVKNEFSQCTEQSIYDAVSNHFADYKRLDGGVYFVDAIPLTTTGKVTRYLVKQMAIERFNEVKKAKAKNNTCFVIQFHDDKFKQGQLDQQHG